MNTFQLTKNEIEKLCISGSLAPSGGNTQPWRVVISGGNNFELKIDKKRSKSFLDVGKYASFFALGCFTQNLLITADWLNLKCRIEFFGYQDINKPLAKITFIDRQDKSTATKNSLFPFIEKRITNRKFYDGSTIHDKYIQQLKKILSDNFKNYKLSTLYLAEEKSIVSEILGRLDVIRILNDELFKEMIQELRWSDEEVAKSKDGLDIKTLELPQNAVKNLILLKKFPSMRRKMPEVAFKDMAKPILMGASHLCCISTSVDLSPKVMFECGRALELLWLVITKLGFSFQPWTIFTFFLIRVNLFNGMGFTNDEVEVIKKSEIDFKKVFGLKNEDFPIFIFRLSKSKIPTARSLRLEWEKFTEIKK